MKRCNTLLVCRCVLPVRHIGSKNWSGPVRSMSAVSHQSDAELKYFAPIWSIWFGLRVRMCASMTGMTVCHHDNVAVEYLVCLPGGAEPVQTLQHRRIGRSSSNRAFVVRLDLPRQIGRRPPGPTTNADPTTSARPDDETKPLVDGRLWRSSTKHINFR